MHWEEIRFKYEKILDHQKTTEERAYLDHMAIKLKGRFV